MMTAGGRRAWQRVRGRATLSLAYALLLLSCDDPLSPDAAIDRIEATPSSLSMTAGESRTISVRAISGSGGTIVRRVFWSTQNPAVATVTQTGLVTAVAPGNTQIAASVGGRAVVVPVSVGQRPVSLVRVTPATAQVQAGATTPLQAQTIDAQGNVLAGRPVLWSTSSAAIATVTSTGQVAGVAPGTVTITASSEGVSGTASVTVIPVPVAAVTVSPNNASLTTGQTLALAATTVGSQGEALTGRVVTWATSNATIASVSSTGVVTGVTPGTVTITAMSEGQSGTAQIRVTLVPVDSVSVSPSVSTVASGQTVQLAARLTDAQGNVLTGRTIAWSTDQPAIATVNQNGLVSALAQGAARISASIDGRSGTATVNVTPIPIARIDVTPPMPSLLVAGTQQLTATPRDAQGNALTGRVITWISGSSTVATVSQTGLVTAVAPGSAVIFAASEGQVGNTTVTVAQVAVATVTVTPTNGNIQQGQALQLTATARDAQGNVIAGRPVTWTSTNEVVATVSSTGRVVGITQGPVTIRASVDGVIGSGSYVITPVPVATVSVTPSVATLTVNQTVQLTVNLFDAAGNPISTAGRVIQWTTSHQPIATVSPSGVVTGVAAGSATISATVENQIGTATITVSLVPVASVTITPAPIPTLNVGGTQAITATARDVAGNVLAGRPVTWSSSNATIATVSTITTASTNTITAVAAGSATISAVVGGITGVAPVTVILVPIANIAVTPSPGSVVEGSTLTLTATATDAGGNVLVGRTIVWSSSNPQVNVTQTAPATTATAAINSAAQSATITASSPGGGAGGTTPSGSSTVSVAYAPVATVQLTPATANLSVGNTATPAITLLSSGAQTLSAVGRTITYALRASDPAGIATVNATTGQVTAVAQGGPVGVVATASSPGQTGTFPADTMLVTVTNVPVATVTVAPSAGSNPGTVHVGPAYARQYAASTFDAGGNLLTGRPVVWTSLNQAIATVDPNTGVVTGVTTGTATIRATSEGVNGNHTVTVDLVPVNSVVVTPVGATLNPSTTPTVQLGAVPLDSAGGTISGIPLGGRTTAWASSDVTAATVNATGLVTAVVGTTQRTTTISATVGGTPPAGTSVITVLPPVASLTISLAPDSVIAPGTLNGTLTAWSGAGGTGTPLAGRAVTLASSNAAFGTVSPASGTTNASGQVTFTLTGVAAGPVTVNATSEGVPQSSGTINVLNPVASVTVAITPADSIIGAGTATATATLRDAGSAIITGRPIAWTSSNTGAATVSGGSLATTTVTALAVTANTQSNISAISEGITGTRVYMVLAPVNTVSLTSPGDSVVGTGTLAIAPTLRDASNNVLTGRPVAWVSRSTAVATVNASSGVVTGVAPGTAWIVATSESKGDSLLVRVLAGINTIALTPATDSIIGTGTVALTATATDAGSVAIPGRPLTASSSTPTVATIAPASGNTSMSGQVALTVTALTTGTTTLTVSGETKTATRVFRVLAPIASVTVTLTTDSVIAPGTLNGTLTVWSGPAGTGSVLAGRPITLSSSVTSFGTVSPASGTTNASGQIAFVVTGVAAGNITVSATGEGVTGTSSTIRVLNPAASVTFSPASATDSTGKSVTFTPTVKDVGGNTLVGRVITWSSSNTARATVASGIATLVDSGGVFIRASVAPGTGAGGIAIDSAAVTIILTPINVLAMPATETVTVGGIKTITALATDLRAGPAGNRACTVSSSNTAVATASPASGNTNAAGQYAITVSGVTAGTADITIVCEMKTSTTVVTVS